MYIIQKHKAREFISKELENSEGSIVYINNIPKIRYIESGEYKIGSLEKYCWHGMKCCRMKGVRSLSFYLTSHVLKIYDVHNMPSLLDNIKIPTICDKLLFFLGTRSMYGSEFTITMQNNEMLLFLTDPLRAMEKMENTPKDTSFQQFFEYYKNIIIKQDKELLLKYLLIGQLVNKLMISDISHVVVDIIICLLL